MIDPPFDEAAHLLQVLQLPMRPGRDVGGHGRQGRRGQGFRPIIDVRPIGARLDVIGIDPQQIGRVGEQARVEAGPFGRGVLLHQKAPIVADVIEAVGDMLLRRFGPGLEDKADTRAVEACGAEIGRCAGNR